MNWTTELPFILDGVDGDLRVVYTPFSQKLYQDGEVTKKTGMAFGGQKYIVRTTDGGQDVVKIKPHFKQGRQVIYKNEQINLENPLGGLAFLLALMPLAFVVVVAAMVMTSGVGIIGGALIGFFGAFGMLMCGNMLRNEQNVAKQLIYSIAISVVTIILLLIVFFIFALFFGAMFGFMFSIF